MRNEENLLALRPELANIEPSSSEIEAFQNKVLRPILKLQHPIFSLEAELNSQLRRVLYGTDKFEKKREDTKKLISTNELRFQFIGQVSGLFTLEEYTFYRAHKKDLDKRIVSMLTDRLLSIVQNEKNIFP